jgi:hypothetical protein
MRWLLLALALLAAPAAAQEYTLQWVHSKLVPAYSAQSLEGPNPFTWASFTFPYTVPEGYVLGITDVQFSSKFTTSGRASYLVIGNLLTLPDNHGSVHFVVPLAVPPGKTITANIINNDEEQQWMGSVITAVLVPIKPGEVWTQVFRRR